jgi:hypothetical protein
MKKFGTRQEVWEEECTMTRGGLTKDDLVLSKSNRLVSKKKSIAARAAYQKFGFKKRQAAVPVQEEEPKKRRRRRKKKSDE